MSNTLKKRIKSTKNGRKLIHKLKALNHVADGGKIFSVKFLKKDGSLRHMTCRLGVKRHLRGGGYNTTAHLPQYRTVYSVNDKNYRNINLCTIKNIKGAGKEFNF